MLLAPGKAWQLSFPPGLREAAPDTYGVLVTRGQLEGMGGWLLKEREKLQGKSKGRGGMKEEWEQVKI